LYGNRTARVEGRPIQIGQKRRSFAPPSLWVESEVSSAIFNGVSFGRLAATSAAAWIDPYAPGLKPFNPHRHD